MPKLNLIWQQSSIVSRNTAVRRVRMRERFSEWGVLSEPSCVFRNFAQEIGVRSAKIDLFAHTRRLTAMLSYDKQLLLTITNTYWAVFQETNLLYFFHVPTAELEFHSIGTGLLMILGLTSQRYLSFSEKGVLRGIVSRNAQFYVIVKRWRFNGCSLYWPRNLDWVTSFYCCYSLIGWSFSTNHTKASRATGEVALSIFPGLTPYALQVLISWLLWYLCCDWPQRCTRYTGANRKKEYFALFSLQFCCYKAFNLPPFLLTLFIFSSNRNRRNRR